MNTSTERALLSGVNLQAEGDPLTVQRVLDAFDGAGGGGRSPESDPAHRVLLRATPGPCPPPGRPVLAQPPVDISLGDDGSVVLLADHLGAVARGAEAEVSAPADADPRVLRAVLDALWPLTLPHLGFHHVHGGALRDPEGRGWLLAGDAGAGKSTTVLSLALEGWEWSSDDASYLARDGEAIVAHGWPEPARLSARSASALRLSREDSISPFKTEVALPPQVIAARTGRIRLHFLVLPELAGETRVERLAPARALDGLLRASAWLMCLPSLASAYMRLLADVAELPAWRLLLGPELLERPAVASRLLAECRP